MFDAQPIAGFDLDCGDAFGNQRVEARQAFGNEFVLAGGADSGDCGADATPRLGDLFIAGASQA